MAPPTRPSATDQAESAIREMLQSLYNVMLHTANYDTGGPQTTVDALVREVTDMERALRDVHAVATASADKLPQLPRDLVQYVEDGRNPDIYTREFVELVRKTNQIRAGKQAAFAQFKDVLARKIRTALPELKDDVDRVVAATTLEPGGIVVPITSTYHNSNTTDDRVPTPTPTGRSPAPAPNGTASRPAGAGAPGALASAAAANAPAPATQRTQPTPATPATQPAAPATPAAPADLATDLVDDVLGRPVVGSGQGLMSDLPETPAGDDA